MGIKALSKRKTLKNLTLPNDSQGADIPYFLKVTREHVTREHVTREHVPREHVTRARD